MAKPFKISGVNLTDLLGQLLVVAHQTHANASLCYEPELIPDQEYNPFWVAHFGSPILSTKNIDYYRIILYSVDLVKKLEKERICLKLEK